MPTQSEDDDGENNESGNERDGGDENNNENKGRRNKGNRKSRAGTVSRFQQWFNQDGKDNKKGPEEQQQGQQNQPQREEEKKGNLSQSVFDFIQTANKQKNDDGEPMMVPRPPSSASGASEILSVKDLEASMQKQSNTVPNQAQHFAQGPKIYGTGRLMNRIPNLINQQMALQHQQKMQEEQQQHQVI